MIDYWEAIGRLACDVELAKGFLKVLPKKKLRSETVKRPEGPCTGVVIPGAAYQAVQRYLEPHLAEGYLSLTAAGELIWAFSYPEIRRFTLQVNRITANARPRRVSSPSASYFITLGALIADGEFREDFLSPSPDSSTQARLRRLPAVQLDNLRSIVTSREFARAIKLFTPIWFPGCLDHLIFYDGLVHPYGINDKTEPVVKLKARAAGY